MYTRDPVIPASAASSKPSKVWKQVLSYYVDDGAMSGSFQEEAWAEIAQHIKSTPPEPLTRVLGVSYTVQPTKLIRTWFTSNPT